MSSRRPEYMTEVVNRVQDSLILGTVVMGQHVTIHLPPEIEPALGSLPPRSAAFAGRATELAVLTQRLAQGGADGPDRSDGAGGADRAGAPPAVHVVTGPPGVGKTEFVLQAAHRARAEPGWFSGGVLFINLHGYAPVPERRIGPGAALGSLLTALGVRSEQLAPLDLQERVRLYNSVLRRYADDGRRILVIIDNASSEAQVETLLPGDPRVAVIVTSRHKLSALPNATLHPLPVLSPHDSVEQLRCELDQLLGDGERRADEDPEAANEIAERCGHLPLALHIVAALLADEPGRSLAGMAADLARTSAELPDETGHGVLDELERAGHGVRAAFDLSYSALPEDEARMFRLFGVAAPLRVSADAAAHLADCTPRRARRLIRALARAHLLEPALAEGRWQMHDLIGLYAEEQAKRHADEDTVETVGTPLGRILEYYYLTGGEAASTLISPDTPGEGFADREEALKWLDAERDNLVAICGGLATADRAGMGFPLMGFLAVLAPYLSMGPHLEDLVLISMAAVERVVAEEDTHAERLAQEFLGRALAQAGRPDEALPALTRALELWREAGSPGEAAVFPANDETKTTSTSELLNTRGAVLRDTGRYDEAVQAHEEAAEIARRVGDPSLEARAYGELGTTLRLAGQYEAALEAHHTALADARTREHRTRQASQLHQIGNVLSEQGRTEEALDAYTRALDLVETDPYETHFRATVLHSLGTTEAEAGNTDRAVAYFGEAVALHADHGGDDTTSATTGITGMLYVAATWSRTGRTAEALDLYTDVLRECRDRRDERGQAGALLGLGRILYGNDRHQDAAGHFERAAALFHTLEDRRGEGYTLLGLARSLWRMDRSAEAADVGREALAAYEDRGSQDDIGVALYFLGCFLDEAGHRDEAVSYVRRAVTIHREAGDRAEEASALSLLADVLKADGRLDEAIDAKTRAADLHQGLGDLASEGNTASSLALLCYRANRLTEAATAHRRALTAHRTTGAILREGRELFRLGNALRRNGHPLKAIPAYAQSTVVCHRAGDKQGRRAALQALSTPLLLLAMVTLWPTLGQLVRPSASVPTLIAEALATCAGLAMGAFITDGIIRSVSRRLASANALDD